MNVADYIILAIIGYSLLSGMRQGLVFEVASLANWIAAWVIARQFGPGLELVIAPHVDPPSLRMPVAFIGLFIATLVVGSLVKRVLRELVSVTGLSGMDRMLGACFGTLRGVFIVVLALGFASRHSHMPEDPWWTASQLVPRMLALEFWVDESYTWVTGLISRVTA